jgi:hypothetical protein
MDSVFEPEAVEETLCLIKPDAFGRKNEIIATLRLEGFNILQVHYVVGPYRIYLIHLSVVQACKAYGTASRGILQGTLDETILPVSSGIHEQW